ncbi:hypothetical protein LK537_00005, partial [Lachnoclostridium pacaense]|uniref:hypothetical protein n=1 Tax=Enterocloster hominis (ex Hitch et al. 2024) TaxID=1917870 RepID=UPI001D10260E
KECWKCAFQHTPTFSIEPALFSTFPFQLISAVCPRFTLCFQNRERAEKKAEKTKLKGKNDNKSEKKPGKEWAVLDGTRADFDCT